MYNQKVIDRLTKLTNLHALKNANVTAMTKKNEFGDVVKFFARINTNNEIESISYKASGCSAFMAVCSYFCELCEGKNLKSALKIKEDDLKKFTDLDESSSHVYKIILDTFALLIKKYNKGVEKGIITPVEPCEKEQEPVKKAEKKVAKKSSTAEKKIVETDISDIISTEKKRKSNKITKNLDVQKTKANSIETAKKTETNSANSQKLSHIEALNSKLKTKETNEKMKDNSKSLNNMLSLIQKTSKPVKSKTTKATKKVETTNEIGTQKVVEEVTVETVIVDDKKTEHAKSASIAFSSLQKTLAGMQKSISTANDNKNSDANNKKAKNEKSSTEKTKKSVEKVDEKSKKLEKVTSKAEEKNREADKKEGKVSKKEEKTAKNEQQSETPKKERKSIFNWFRKK